MTVWLFAEPGVIETRDGNRIQGDLQFGSGAFKATATNGEIVTVELTNLRRVTFDPIPKQIIPKDRLDAAPSATTNLIAATPTNGLLASYYNSRNLTGPMVNRIDPQIDFDWGDGPPAPGIDAEGFSVRWSGQVKAQFSEPYTFFTFTDDGVRLWVDDRLVIDAWRIGNLTAVSQPILLTANQAYAIKMESFNAGGRAVAKLSWTSPSTPLSVITPSQFCPPAVTDTLVANPAAATPPLLAGVLVRGGSFIAASITSADDSSVSVSGVWKRLPLSTVNVARIRFQPLSMEMESKINSGRPGVLLRNGDFVDGEFKGVEKDRVKISSVLFGLRYFATHQEAMAVVLRAVKSEPWEYKITAFDGSTLLARSIGIETNALAVDLSGLTSVRMPAAEVREIERAREKSISEKAVGANWNLASAP